VVLERAAERDGSETAHRAADARRGEGARLVGLSFLMLFVELALIRWTGSRVVYLSYFSNFVLLGSFLGIGLGFLSARRRFDLFALAPVALALIVVFVSAFPVVVSRASSQVLYFGKLQQGGLPAWATLPVIFLASAGVMAFIGQGVARTFGRFPPLVAYRYDILGSLAGIAAFSLLSFLDAPPVAWGAIASVMMLVLLGRRPGVLQIAAVVVMLALLGGESLERNHFWSPYYAISLDRQPGWTEVFVNGVPHQTIEPISRRRRVEPIYFEPYRLIRHNPLRHVLIIGAGNGGDVAIALHSGADRVDGVEIDPRLYALGRRLNPDHPYQDPRVNVIVDDGRAYLQRTHRRYDLILFALPDSLTLVSGQSSIRLESYLFTLEGIRAARSHLRPGGAFGMYNFYREQWLVDRFANTLAVTFGRRPCITQFGTLSLLMAGRNAGAVQCKTVWAPGNRTIPPPATDDHPFPYLRRPSIPSIYINALLLILVVSAVLVRCVAGPVRPMARYLDLFFMGAAFLLIETENVVRFALLFGTTWFVNALVFGGILLSVLAAIEVSRRITIRKPLMLYSALLLALVIAWLVPPGTLLALGVPSRFAAATLVAFLPIFLANLIFAQRFRDVGSSVTAFGANLLGAMVGGVLEYLALITGYHALLVVIAGLYGLAFLAGRRHLAVPAMG
jgi:SAM-dependent methyltransferase